MFKVCRLRTSNETQHYPNHHVSALDPPVFDSPVGRYRPRVRTGWIQAHTGDTYCDRLAVRNARAGWSAVGVHHHPARIGPRVAHASCSHEGSRTRRRPDRWLQRSSSLGLDAPRGGRDLVLLCDSRGAGIVEPATKQGLNAGKTHSSPPIAS